MKKFLGLFILFLTSCYTTRYVADVNIQYDPLTEIERENSVIYIDTKALPEGIESRKLKFNLKNSLENNFYRTTDDEKRANVILKVNNKIIQKKIVNFVTVPEETEIKKSKYDKKDTFFSFPEPRSKTTYTTYKKVPLEGIYEVYHLYLSFMKLKGNEKIESIRAEMEVEIIDFEKDIEIFINKFIEQISLQKEIRNTRIVWKQK